MSAVTHSTPATQPGNRLATAMPVPAVRDAALERDRRLHSGTIDLVHAAAIDWDALVIGAGPAGALAARQLARAGVRTLLVEKTVFPRAKVCGGCLNGEAVAALRRAGLQFLVEPPVAVPLDRLALRCRGSNVVLNLPGGAAIARRSFDAQLVLEAIRCAAEFLPGTTAAIGDRPVGQRWRTVQLQSSDQRQACARARVILAADGLNQTSQRNITPLRGDIAKSCRIGLGTVISAGDVDVEPGTIDMRVSRNGYVGMVRTSDNRITIAAAVDPAMLKSVPPGVAIQEILRGNGAHEALVQLAGEAEWRGTSPLTRFHRCVAVDNVLVLGDAAGYVEPFTGDGMSAAIHAALAAEPLVTRHLSRGSAPSGMACATDSGTSQLSAEWISTHRSIIRQAQRRCRFLAGLLRRPTAVRAAIKLVSIWPALAKPFVSPKSALESSRPMAEQNTIRFER